MRTRAHASRFTASIAVAVATATALTAAPARAAETGETVLTSPITLPAGAIGGNDSGTSSGEPDRSSVSADGRYVAFPSTSDTFSADANTEVTNVFRKDRVTGAVVLVSRGPGATTPGPAATSDRPIISADGNRVAFTTTTRLSPADTDDRTDVYVRDIATGTTTLATPNTLDSVFRFDLSGNGDSVAFSTTTPLAAGDTNTNSDVYRYTLSSTTIELASARSGLTTAGDGISDDAAVSDNGRWVAFSSTSSNLISGFVAGTGYQVFVRDTASGLTYLVSAKASDSTSKSASNGDASGPRIAGTPTSLATVVVAYDSSATNVATSGDTSTNASVYVRKMGQAGAASTLVSRATGVSGTDASSRANLGGISDDGDRVVFASDAQNLGGGTSGYYGAYTRTLTTGTTTLLSARNDYAVSADISGDGTLGIWNEGDLATGLTQVWARTFPGGPIEMVSRPAGSAPYVPAAASVGSNGRHTVSGDGRYVVFAAVSTQLPSGDPTTARVYRRDLLTGVTELVGRADDGTPAEVSASSRVSIDDAGNRVAFTSYTPLVPDHPSSSGEAYVRDLTTGRTTLVSRASGATGAPANTGSDLAQISGDGTHVMFASSAANLGVPGGTEHLYVRDLGAGTTTLVDRKTGAGGAISDTDTYDGDLSADGNRILFPSSAKLDPDDVGNTQSDAYLRDVASATTTLVGRRPGLTGARVATYSAAISGDGNTIAFVTYDGQAAPEAGPWGGAEVVARNLATGANTLVSRTPGGAPADGNVSDPAIDRDGHTIAFESNATGLIPGLGGDTRSSVFVRDMTTGKLTGPPAFGLDNVQPQSFARDASLSADGRCLAFTARGHNAISGAAGDFQNAYLYAISGPCPKPLPVAAAPTPTTGPAPLPPVAISAPAKLAAPSITKLSLTNKRFTLVPKKSPKKKPKTPAGTAFKFTLSTAATVTLAVDRPSKGRKDGKTCKKSTKKLAKKPKCTFYTAVGSTTTATLKAGAASLAFTGTLGKKTLTAGTYRATITAKNAAGTSAPLTITFTVVKK